MFIILLHKSTSSRFCLVKTGATTNERGTQGFSVLALQLSYGTFAKAANISRFFYITNFCKKFFRFTISQRCIPIMTSIKNKTYICDI